MVSFEKLGNAENNLEFPSDLYKLSWDNWFFSWVNTIISRGQNENFDFDDMLRLPARFSSFSVINEFAVIWKAEYVEKRSCLFTVLHKIIFTDFWISGFLRFLNDILSLYQAFLVKTFVLSVETGDRYEMMALALLFFVVSLAQVFVLQMFIHGSFMSAAKVSTAVTSAVYRSSLELRLNKLTPAKTVAEINNISQKDAAILREFVVFAHNLWSLPMTILIAASMLYYLLGYSGLVCCIILPAFTPLERYLAAKLKVLRKSGLKCSDERMHLVNQLVDGIRTIKFTNLTDFAMKRVTDVRNEELNVFQSSLTLQVLNFVISRSIGMFVTLATFGVYILISPAPLNAGTIFAALALINLLGRPIQVLPKCVSMYTDTVVSLERVESVLVLGYQSNPNCFNEDVNAEKISGKYEISLKNVSAYRGDKEVLRGVNLQIDKPGLIVMLGSNGSGKTSVLLAILKEIQLNDVFTNNIARESAGAVLISPNNLNIAYCSQEAWILNATAKQNILIGAIPNLKSSLKIDSKVVDYLSSKSFKVLEDSIDEALYLQAVNACALTDDFAKWPQGENTIIGEKGITISGGQRHRLSIARAIYSQAKVVLIDAILSSLDAEVASHVFQEAIVNILSKKSSVLLVTHQSHFIPSASRVIILENGTICFDGNYNELMRSTDLKMDQFLLKFEESVHKSVTKSTCSDSGKIVKGSGKGAFRDNMEKVKGELSYQLYWDYIKACGKWTFFMSIAVAIFAYSLQVLNDYTIALWVNGVYGDGKFIVLYSILITVLVGVNVVRFTVFILSSLSGSKLLHEQLLDSILRAPLEFFNTTPSGRITSRFSVDMTVVDFEISQGLLGFVECGLAIITGLVTVVAISPVAFVLYVPLAYQYMQYRNLYRLPSTRLKKMDSVAKAPVFSFNKESLEGLECIRGYKSREFMLKRHAELVDRGCCARINWDAVNRWLGIRLDVIGALIVSFAAISVAIMGKSSAGFAGLLMTYSTNVTARLAFVIRVSTALENSFNSPERIFEYIRLEHEDSDTAKKVDEDSEDVGLLDGGIQLSSVSQAPVYQFIYMEPSCLIEVSHLYARYAKDSPDALVDINFSLKGGEFIGLCGRTGCGKSTLSMALVGGLSNVQGHVNLNSSLCDNDSNISTLMKLRRFVQVFPQDCYILAGKVREIINPYGLYSDFELNAILNDLWSITEGLESSISNSKITLDFELTQGGGNLSTGQRQLLVFMRVVFSGAKIVFLDEIFSCLDFRSASRALNVITKYLLPRGVTVILIAHTLQDIALCDRLWVMDSGKIVEEGLPKKLLANYDSKFRALVLAMGGDAQILRISELIESRVNDI